MKGKSILLLILTYAAVSRFFLLDKLLPFTNITVLNGRFISAVASLAITLLVFYCTKIYSRNTKIALISAWVINLMPWTFEQGRIISQPNLTLALIMLVLFIIQRTSYKNKAILLFLIPIIFFFFYPQFWLLRLHGYNFNFYAFVFNLFSILSFDFLFFKNYSFWWGGVKEFGIMLLSFLPFLLEGIYQVILHRRFKLLLLIFSITIVTAASRFFPETREFYFSTPILAFLVATGIYYFFLKTGFVIRILFICIFIVVLYELSQYYHFYFIHYPQDVRGNFSQIHESY